MKLLFDEHFSYRSVKLLSQDFPGCHHINFFNLENASDEKIWYFAAREGYTIVTKDDDFHQRALTLGGPPKIIWINTPNMRRAETEQFFRSKREQIIDFENRKESLLVLSG